MSGYELDWFALDDLVEKKPRRDQLAGNEFAWLLRASRRGVENDQASAGWIAFKARLVKR